MLMPRSGPTERAGARSASTARERAVDTLREVLERSAPVTPLLAARGEGLAASDQDLFRELVLGVLRWRSALDAELAEVCRVPLTRLASDLREILEVALYQIRHLDRVPAYAAVDEAVKHARESGGDGAGGLVNAVLRAILRGRGQPAGQSPPPPEEGRGQGGTLAAVLACRFSHPGFLVARWLERFGEGVAKQILEADNSPSGLDLMVNPERTDRETLASALADDGVVTEPSSLSPIALTVVAGNPLRSALFRDGHFTVQDVGSQILPLLLPPGEVLVDLAAAPGGKSLASLFLGRAERVLSVDRSYARLRLLCENRARLKTPEAMPVAGDVLVLPLPVDNFDRVLFDAPCSGTGTLRKNPEIRYRVTPAAIERLSREQERGLSAATSLLAPGGYLLYSTCSLEEEENRRVVERLLDANPWLEPAPIAAPKQLLPFVTANCFQMLPGPTNDGFTAHLIRRK